MRAGARGEAGGDLTLTCGAVSSVKIIRVIYHHADSSWWAESPDVERWYAAGDTFDEVVKLAQEGIPFALERDDVELEHCGPAGEHIAA
jgi:predicted RNase H-like HicB family nuclease